MKEFELKDVFLFSKIIDKMGLTVEAERLSKTINAKKLENKEDAKELGKQVFVSIGIDYATKFLSNLHKAEKEVMEFISNMTEKKLESVQTMKMKDIKQFFIDLINNDGFKDFFDQAETSEE